MSLIRCLIYYLSLGVGGATGNLLVGWSFDLAQAIGLALLPWVLLAAVGLASAAAVLGLERRGLLTVLPEAIQSA